MKKYEDPIIEIKLFNAENIITVSGVSAIDAARESLGIDTEDGVASSNLFEFIF